MTSEQTKHINNLIQQINQSATLGDAIQNIHEHLSESDTIQAFTTKDKAIVHFMSIRDDLDKIAPMYVTKHTDTSVSLNEWLFNQMNEHGVAKDGSVIVLETN